MMKNESLSDSQQKTMQGLIVIDEIKPLEHECRVLHSRGMGSISYDSPLLIFLMEPKYKIKHNYSSSDIFIYDAKNKLVYCIRGDRFHYEKFFGALTPAQPFTELLKSILMHFRKAYADDTVELFIEKNSEEIPVYQSLQDIHKHIFTVAHKAALFFQNRGDSALASGKFLDRDFRIKEVLRGGMGIVYIATNIITSSTYAIKSIQEQFFLDNSMYGMFIKEAEFWIKLEKHPNIVQAYYIKMIDSKPFLFLEYVDGTNLENLIVEKQQLSLKEALNYGIQISAGMRYAYNKLKLIHRDIKPANCLITKKGTLKISDFGLAKILTDTTSQKLRKNHGPDYINPNLTQVSIVEGTLPYMAPECFTSRTYTIFSDIYSFGVLMYEMLTGRKPITGNDAAEYLYLHENPYIPNISLYRNDVPEDLRNLILKCLAKKPGDRYRNFAEIEEALKDIYRQTTGGEFVSTEQETELTVEDIIHRGQSLASLGKHNEAVKYFDRALWKERQSEDALTARGQSLMAMGSYKEALSCFNKAIAQNPENVTATVEKGNCYLQLRRFQDALSCYNKALATEPANELAWISKGVYYLKLKQYQESIRTFNQILKINSASSEAWFYRGQVMLEINDFEKALLDFTKAVEINPRWDLAWIGQGNALAMCNRHKEAIAAFRNARELAPENEQAWFGLVKSLFLDGDYQECYRLISEKRHEKAEDKELIWILFETQKHLRDYEGALESCSILYSDADGMGACNPEFAELYERLYMFSEALQCCEAMSRHQYYGEQGRALAEKISARRKIFRETADSLLKKNVTPPEGDSSIPAFSKEEEKRIKKLIRKKSSAGADECFAEALELLDRNEPWAAMQLILDTIKIQPEHKEAWYTMGCLMEELELEENAVYIYGRCIKLRSYRFESWFSLARIYLKRKLYSQAMDYAVAALHENAGNQYLWLLALALALKTGKSSLFLPLALKAQDVFEGQQVYPEFQANLHLFLGRPGAAQRTIDRAIEEGAGNSYLTLLAAKTAIAWNNAPLALDRFHSLQMDNEAVDFYYRGLAMIVADNTEEAMACFETSVVAEGTFSEGRLAMVMTHILEKAYRESEKLLEEPMPDIYATADGELLRASMETAQGKNRDAGVTILTASQNYPWHSELELAKLIILGKNTDNFPSDPIEDYCRKNPADDRGYTLLSALYLKAGRYEKAEKVILQGLKIMPYSAMLLNNYGVCKSYDRLLYEIEECIETAVRENDMQPAILNNAGLISLQKNNPEKAMEYIARAYAMEPDNRTIHYGFVLSLFTNQRYQEVQEEYDSNPDMFSRQPQFMALATAASLLAEDIHNAVKICDRFLHLYPEDFMANFLKGLIYRITGISNNSLLSFRTALDMLPASRLTGKKTPYRSGQEYFVWMVYGNLMLQCGFREEGESALQTAATLLMGIDIDRSKSEKEMLYDYFSFTLLITEFLPSFPELPIPVNDRLLCDEIGQIPVFSESQRG